MTNRLKNTNGTKSNNDNKDAKETNNVKESCVKKCLITILNIFFREPLFNEWLFLSDIENTSEYKNLSSKWEKVCFIGKTIYSIIEKLFFAIILVVVLDSIYNALHKININFISISIAILLLISTYQSYKTFMEELNHEKYLLIKEIYYNINNILLVSSIILLTPLRRSLFIKETNTKTLLLVILLVIIFVAGLRLMDFIFYCVFKLLKKIENNTSNNKWFNIRKKRKFK